MIPFTFLVIWLVTACAVSSTTTTPAPTVTLGQLPTVTSEPSLAVIPPATQTAMPTLAMTPTSTPPPTPLPASVLLEPMNHQWQTYNNCHRASVAVALGYYSYQISQHAVRFPYGLGQCQIPRFVSRYGLVAQVYRFPLARDQKVRVMRQVLALGIPVIVLQRVSIGSTIYHFRVIHGYDDAPGEFISADSLLGPDHRIPYDTFVRLGGALLIPIYLPGMDAQVQSLIKEAGAYSWTNEDGLTCSQLESP